MAALFSLLIAVVLFLLITRVATEALALTGLSRESAKFQARSAFTGAGFTTSESEQVVNHPVRRRIMMWLMFLGNVGVVTVVTSLVLTFASTARADNWLPRLLLLVLGIAVLWFLAINRAFDRFLTRVVRMALRHWTDLDVRDYAHLLHLKGEYRVMELQVEPQDWLADKRLDELSLRDEGVVVLGIQRSDKTYIGAPMGTTTIRPFDLLVLYGRLSILTELDSRRADAAGEQAHNKAIALQQQIKNDQDRQDTLAQA